MSTFMKVAVIAIIVCYSSNANIIRIRQQKERKDPPSSNGTTLPATKSGKDQQIDKKVAGNADEENILSGRGNVQVTSSRGVETRQRPLLVLHNDSDVGVKRGATDEFLFHRKSRSKDRPEQRTTKRQQKSMLYPLSFEKRRRGSLLRPDLVDKQPGDTSNGPNPPFPPTPEPSTGDKKGGVVKSPPTIFENNNKTGAVYNVFLNLDLGKDSKRTRKVLRKLFDALDEDDSATPPAPFPSEESDSDYDYKEEPAAVEGTTGLSPLDLLKKSGSALSQEEILTITHPCSTDHKRYIRKREEAGCIGAIAFSTIVCREFLDCMLTEDGPLGKCGPKICTQFKAMPKSGKCFRELFACK